MIIRDALLKEIDFTKSIKRMLVLQMIMIISLTMIRMMMMLKYLSIKISSRSILIAIINPINKIKILSKRSSRKKYHSGWRIKKLNIPYKGQLMSSLNPSIMWRTALLALNWIYEEKLMEVSSLGHNVKLQTPKSNQKLVIIILFE